MATINGEMFGKVGFKKNWGKQGLRIWKIEIAKTAEGGSRSENNDDIETDSFRVYIYTHRKSVSIFRERKWSVSERIERV